jgi:hypothetical protein
VDPSTDLITWEIGQRRDRTRIGRIGRIKISIRESAPIRPIRSIRVPFDARIQVRDTYPSGMAWTPDSAGFFYDRVLPFSGGHALYFHAVGTPQREDRCILYHADHPDWYYQPHVSPDGRWLAVSILNGSAANRLTVIALVGQTLSPPYEIIPRFVGRYDVIHWQGDQLILRVVEPKTPNGCLLAVDLPGGARTLVLPERDLPLLDAAPLGEAG